MRTQRVHKTELLARLSRLFATRKCFCLAASLMILIAAPLRAGETTMTLAMNQPPRINSTELYVNYSSLTDNSLFDLKNSRPETSGLNSGTALVISAEGCFERETIADQFKSFSLARKDSHANKSVSFHFGYCCIWDDDSILRKNAPDHQEPGVAYVSTNFSF